MPGISQQVWCILCTSSSPGEPNTLARTRILGSSPGHPLATLVVSILKTQWYFVYTQYSNRHSVFISMNEKTMTDDVNGLRFYRKILHTHRFFLSVYVYLCLSLSFSVSLQMSLFFKRDRLVICAQTVS